MNDLIASFIELPIGALCALKYALHSRYISKRNFRVMAFSLIEAEAIDIESIRDFLSFQEFVSYYKSILSVNVNDSLCKNDKRMCYNKNLIGAMVMLDLMEELKLLGRDDCVNISRVFFNFHQLSVNDENYDLIRDSTTYCMAKKRLGERSTLNLSHLYSSQENK